MCQLTFFNVPDSILGLTISLQMYINSDSHRDGFGLFSISSGIIKLPEKPDYAFGRKIFEYLVSKNLSGPCIGHVRQKSFAYKVLENRIEDTHPFEKEFIVLAHNGTLTSIQHKNDKVIDSELFAGALNDAIAVAPSEVIFQSALETVMKDFEGKFAFLIFDKRTRKYYAARGTTADLYYAPLHVDGEFCYIINTEKDSLNRGLTLLILAAESMGTHVSLLEEIKIMQESSIFELQGKPVRVGTITENSYKYNYGKDAALGTDYDNPFHGSYRGWGADWGEDTESFYNNGKVFHLPLLADISINEIDELIFHIMNKTILECSFTELKVILEVIDKILKSSLIEQKLSLVKNLKDAATVKQISESDLAFPLVSNTADKLKDARKIFEKINAENRRRQKAGK